MSDINPWYILILCTAGTFFWRAAGVFLSSHVNSEGIFFQWLNCVAYALLSGLISRVIVLPSGQLENTTLPDRLLPVIAGFVIFFLCKKNIIAATLVAFFSFLIIQYCRHLSLF
tara:strand:+ start:814 stop:1155 length:342 start_codon:yes stop_codon:yes gene_type:complete